MRNRNKYDWSKPFKFISTKEEFDSIETNDDNLVVTINNEQKKPEKKMNIKTPDIEIVPPVGVKKKFAKISPNYIRLPAHLNLPHADHYELTEVDHTFVKTHQDRYIYKNKRILTHEFLQKAMVEMELKAGKDMNLPRSKGWMMAFLEQQYKDLLGYEHIEQFAENVYNFWKNRREELKFPLLRMLWKPNPDEYNHMLAFRPREREKRSLRRTNRVVEDQIIEELYEEFDVASKIVDRIQMREQLKMKQMTTQLASFYNDCKSLIPVPDFIEELKPEDRVKDKERMKAFHANLDSYKNRKQTLENIMVQQPGTDQVDQKQSIVNFLSTVVYEAELLGINYQKLFTNTGAATTRMVPPSAALSISPSTYIEEERAPVQPPPGDSGEQYLKFSVELYEDMLIRTFDEEESPVFHVKPCTDYLQLKRRKVDRYYFGSDDEGETKDLKKNIATSYKKWQNLQHIPRTISATSQN